MTHPTRPTDEREHILAALVRATEVRDQLLPLVGAAQSDEDALSAICELLGTDGKGAAAVLEMSLRRFTVQSRMNLAAELADLHSQAR